MPALHRTDSRHLLHESTASFTKTFPKRRQVLDILDHFNCRDRMSGAEPLSVSKTAQRRSNAMDGSSLDPAMIPEAVELPPSPNLSDESKSASFERSTRANPTCEAQHATIETLVSATSERY